MGVLIWLSHQRSWDLEDEEDGGLDLLTGGSARGKGWILEVLEMTSLRRGDPLDMRP